MERQYSSVTASDKMAKLFSKALGIKAIQMVFGLITIVFIATSGVQAQVSGAWDSFTGNGTPGNFNYGNGVIRLISDVNTGCAGGAVHETSTTYDPTLGVAFSRCYQVFFGCPGNDEINSDLNGDGMAFSFSKCAYNINNGLACGGGLGYMGSCPQMITIEFDTYSSAFDGTYGGGTSGINDEISVHFNGDAGTSGIIPGGTVNAGNLEDGLEHTICITYTPGTRILAVTIDGVPRLNFDLGPTYNLQTYFGAGGLNQTWSSGKFGATNPTTVNDGNGTTIVSQLGGVPLCPTAVDITSPSNNSVIDPCNGPITITATATPPAGATVTSVEFRVDGTPIGTDMTFPYSANWTPTTGNHIITAFATYSNATNSTSPNTNITVGSISLTSTAPTIDGTIDPLWASYPSFTLTRGLNSAPDLAATYKVMYNSTYLYVLVDVTDDVLINNSSNWEDDGIEIFIDIDNTKIGCCGYGANVTQSTFIATPGNIANTAGPNGSNYAKQNRAGGYTMEMRFQWTSLKAGFTPTPGANLGFDVSINDDDDNGTRDNQLVWNANAGSDEWQNASLFGTLPFSSCNPLPVSFVSFTGKMVNGQVLLNWITADEVNNDKFIIERSCDSEVWEAIGEVDGIGNTNALVNYNFKDNSYSCETIYYRLRQIDINGEYAYSTIVVVDATTQLLSISPNPFQDVLTIKSNVEGSISITIHDVLGRLVYAASKEAIDGVIVIQPELSSGAYFLTVNTGSIVEQRKIIKN